MNFCGIDPGASGGIAVVGERPVVAWKMPATERDIAEVFEVASPDFAMIERCSSRPGQGVSSTFKFGRNYGFLRGMLIAYRIPFEEVTPHVWQRYMGCLSRGQKNITKQKAQQLFPNLKITHAVADALLIADYCRRIKTQASELTGLAEKLKQTVTA